MPWKAKALRWELLKPVVRQMRSAPTRAELCLWQRLRQDRLGVRFRRQFMIGSFVVDFYCPQARLVVEVDGPVHLARAKRDAQRDRMLVTMGLRVLRFVNEQVLGDTDSVTRRIQEALKSGAGP